MTILDQLAEHAGERVSEAKRKISPKDLKQQALSMQKGSFAFENALRKDGISFICECKKASPSKGLIAPEFPYLQIAEEYEAAGADCISVLTEPKWFLGSNEYLKEIADAVSIPCLRKDFTVDEYMIYEAKVLGASAVLLICSILGKSEIREYLQICDELGLSALVETHDEREVQMALDAGARVIGVNNRNLKDFSVNTDNSRRLRELIPSEVLFVSESGVQTAEDVAALRKIGADAVLIGETLMRAADKKAKLAELRGVEGCLFRFFGVSVGDASGYFLRRVSPSGSGSRMRVMLTTAPVRAKPPASRSAVWVLFSGTMWNRRAISAAPVIWPTRRAVASMPLALPLRWGGAEAISMLLLGDWNSPNPAPQSTSRHAMSKGAGSSGRKASRNSPAAMAVSPMPPRNPAWTRSTRRPAIGATTMITAGHAVISSPVATSS